MFNRKSTSNNLNIGFALLVVFLLVFATNRIDKKHFETVQETLTTVYKDRVLAQDYVYQMSGLVHQKKLQYISTQSVQGQDAFNKAFADLLAVFLTTKLTPDESDVLDDLEQSFNALKLKENAFSVDSGIQSLLDQIAVMESELKDLSLIQVSESRNLTDMAQKSLDMNHLISNLEIAVLIIIGIIIQFAIFYRTEKYRKPYLPKD